MEQNVEGMAVRERQLKQLMKLNRITNARIKNVSLAFAKLPVMGSFISKYLNQNIMATINYTTLQLPKILWEYSELIQDTPHFEVRRYKHKKGIIFRIPKGAEVGQTFHAFMEHEINLSNTLRTGTLTR